MEPLTEKTELHKVRVWDLGVRLFHWLLVAVVGVAAWTGFLGGKSMLDLHLVAGACLVVLVLHRLVWGLLGSTHARFRNFVPGPVTVVRHAAALLRGRAAAETGHNPLGAVMILALLAVLAGLTATGLVALGGIFKEGPLAPMTAFSLGSSMRRVHELLAYALGGLVALHVLGVLIESLRTRENLAGAMVHGRKLERGEHGVRPTAARPWAAMAATVALVSATTAAGLHASLAPAPGVPSEPLNATYAKECGACHSPHHPSLAPAAQWARVLAGLEDHFGDNAGLGSDAAASISAYLAANAGEYWDTEAANVMRERSATEPMRITATPGWQALHARVTAAAFESKAVAGKANCSQCHADAETGRFLPRHIRLPADTASPSSTAEKRP